jgi:glycosyltransferase involved in cell wall biosynthesis
MLGKGLGGIEQAFVDYLTAFDNLNHKSVGVISKGAKIKQKISPNIKIKRISNFGEWDIFASMKLKLIINKLRPDVIIAHGRRAAKLVKPAAGFVPVVGVAQNYSFNHMLKLDYVFSTTNDLKDNLVKLGYDEKKIFHIPNMIDANAIKLDPLELLVKFREPPVIGVMGRFVKKKGFDLFIKALSILHDEGIKFHGIIAGEGEEKNNLKSLTKSLHLESLVSFPGWITDKKKFFSSIDIFCLPSLHEPFGIILLEALCYNKPTVAFPSEGPKEIGSDNKDVVFAEFGNERDLAEKIKLLLKSKALASKLAKEGRRLIKEKYSLEIVQTAIEACVQKIHLYAESKVSH